jgi:hypothetical protein
MPNLGAKERVKLPNERKLGTAVVVPTTHAPVDLSWLQINQQGETPFCGEHAASHLQAILEHAASGTINRFSPRYGAIKLKTPGSPVYDGFSVEEGTDMTAIFKWLKTIGVDLYEPLENNVSLPLDAKPGDYLDPAVVTLETDASAGNHKDIDFAYSDTVTYETIVQAIQKYKAAVILIKCDDGFWGTSSPTFTQPLYGHFVTAYDWDDTGIWVVDSAEPNLAYSLKHIDQRYLTSLFFFELGTAVDALPIETQIVSDTGQVVPDVAQDTQDTPAEKKTLLGELEEIVEDIETVI